jgi:hypothetical protein
MALEGCEGVEWIKLAQDTGKLSAVVKISSIKCGEFLD